MHELAPLAGVDMSVQYTWARFWGAQRYPDDVVTTSDVDTVPLSRNYFVDQLQCIPDDRYVHICSLDTVRPARQVALLTDPSAEWIVRADEVWRFHAFYHIARGGLFKDVLVLPDDWEQAAREMAPYNLDPMPNDNRGRTASGGWGGDELYPTAKIHAYRDPSIFTVLVHKNAYLSPEGRLLDGGKRLDGWGVWDPTLLGQGHYSYMHVRRPCTPASLAMIDYLLSDNQHAGKVQKWRAAEKDFLKHREQLPAQVKYAARLLMLSCFVMNRSPLDIACSRQMRGILKNAMKAKLKILLRRHF